MTTNFLYRATEGITEEDLGWMPLEQQDLPIEFPRVPSPPGRAVGQ